MYYEITKCVCCWFLKKSCFMYVFLQRHKRARTFDVVSTNKGNSQSVTTTEKTFNIIVAGLNCPPGTSLAHTKECRDEALFSAVPSKRKS